MKCTHMHVKSSLSHVKCEPFKTSHMRNVKEKCEIYLGNEQQNACDELKARLTSSPVLIFPDYSQEFILCTDASDIGLGGILMQKRNIIRKTMAGTATITLMPVRKKLKDYSCSTRWLCRFSEWIKRVPKGTF